MDTAAGLQELGELYGLTHEQIGERIGKSRVYVTNHLRLLKLAPSVQAQVNEGLISLGHAKVLAGLDLDQQPQRAHEIITQRLSVRALEQRRAGDRGTPIRKPASKGADWTRFERRVSEFLGYPVSIQAERGGRGELKVRFHSLEDLDGLLEKMGFRSEP